LKFLLDENVPISIKKVIQDNGFKAFTLHDFNMLGIKNGKVAELALNNNAIILA
jgi:predicted nuclease of predicted toxin-antitoxin system